MGFKFIFMNKTFIPVVNYNKRKWYVIDCKDKQLGRLSSTIIPLLTGKSKSVYHPSIDVGDYVILINSEYLKLDRDIQRLVNMVPKRIIENCVFNMLPNGFPKKHLVKRLKVYQSDQHPHGAQNPKFLDVL